MLQTIITYIIVFVAFLIVSFRVYKSLTRKNDQENPCGGCTGCDLKNEILKNKKIKADGCNDHKVKE